MNRIEKRIAFVGAGAIAETWIERLVKYKLTEPHQVLATDIRPEPLAKLKERWGIRTSAANSEAAGFGDYVVLAVPPPATLPVLRELEPTLRDGQVILSLAAALPVAFLEDVARNRPVVRIMPNTPALVGEAMNLVVFGQAASTEVRKRVSELLDLLGQWSEVADKDVDDWCALCAVGPTFLLPVLEVLAAVAAERGLPPKQTLQAVAQTFAGTARMVIESGRTPEELKKMIGLRTLKEEDARKLFTDAYHEAIQKLQATGQKVAVAARE